MCSREQNIENAGLRERARIDAQVEHDAWSRAAEIVAYWADAARLIGNDELTSVMENAEADAQAEVSRTLDVLEDFQVPALRVVE